MQIEDLKEFNHLLDIDGLVEVMKDDIKSEIKNLVKVPVLKIVGDIENSSIKSYYKQIVKLCDELGIVVINDTIDYVLDELIRYNNKEITLNYYGLLILLPLKDDHEKIKYNEIRRIIPPEVDVDRISSVINKNEFMYNPATVDAIFDILSHNEIKVEGKIVTVIGRSENLGLPCINEFIRRDACVTVLHSKVIKYKHAFTPVTDILVTATGIPNLISSDDISDNAVVIDIGCGFDKNGKLHGDFDYNGIDHTKIRYTPVPNGVGKITTLELLRNTVNSRRKVLTRNK